MTDESYVPLTDDKVAAIREDIVDPIYPVRRIQAQQLLADRDYWKRRAEAAEKRSDRCSECHGRGWLLYANTTTYMHGVGGNAMTKDVCEVCWGSGDERNPFRNLREIMQACRARLAE